MKRFNTKCFVKIASVALLVIVLFSAIPVSTSAASTYLSKVVSFDDHDTYTVTFKPSKSGVYEIITSYDFYDGTFDPALTLYNSSWKKLAYNDNGFDFDGEEDNNARIQFYLEAGKTYKIECGGSEISGGEYTLIVRSPRLLQINCCGYDVKMLQYFIGLMSTYYSDIPSVSVDGYFGQETRNAVIKLQKKLNVLNSSNVADGVVRPELWNAIYERCYRFAVKYTQNYPIYYYNRPIFIERLQYLICILSFNNTAAWEIDINGNYSPETRRAETSICNNLNLNVGSGLYWQNIHKAALGDITKY